MAIKYTFVGHGTHMLDIGGKKVVVDPFFTSNPTTDVSADSVTADYVLVSHGHFDHIEDAVAIAKRTGATVIANFEIISWLQGQGVPEAQCHAQHLGGGFNYDFGQVKLTVAHHGSGLPDGSYGGNPGGFLLTLKDGKRLYFACDTDLFSDMQRIGAGGLDLAVVPIGDRYTMGPDDAVEALKLLGPKRALPCHYNTWPPIAQDAGAWAAQVKAATRCEPLVIQPGETVEI